ncbi:MAG: hypothetical protein OEY26_07290, partial [Nitrospinota bacterium]|nr:hypothetical protein [Nitrospinota bacterium]
NLAKAQRLSQKAVKSDPQNHRYLDTLAEVYYVRGKTDSAVETINKALAIDKDNRLYKQQLWRFKHVKATPKKVEASAPSEAVSDSESSEMGEDTSNSSNTEASEESTPEEETPETFESQPVAEEL